jgi:hypothetical protein
MTKQTISNVSFGNVESQSGVANPTIPLGNKATGTECYTAMPTYELYVPEYISTPNGSISGFSDNSLRKSYDDGGP